MGDYKLGLVLRLELSLWFRRVYWQTFALLKHPFTCNAVKVLQEMSEERNIDRLIIKTIESRNVFLKLWMAGHWLETVSDRYTLNVLETWAQAFYWVETDVSKFIEKLSMIEDIMEKSRKIYIISFFLFFSVCKVTTFPAAGPSQVKTAWKLAVRIRNNHGLERFADLKESKQLKKYTKLIINIEKEIHSLFTDGSRNSRLATYGHQLESKGLDRFTSNIIFSSIIRVYMTEYNSGISKKQSIYYLYKLRKDDLGALILYLNKVKNSVAKKTTGLNSGRR